MPGYRVFMTDDCWLYGGARRDRTADPLLAKQVLSQLSYGPLLVFLAPAFVVRILRSVTY